PFLVRKAKPGAAIVCTGDLELAQLQIDGYRAAFARLVAAERFDGGFRWVFREELGLASQLAGLLAREAGCCSFLSFELKKRDWLLIWETRADERGAAVLEMYFGLPDKLRAEPRGGHDLAALKRAADDAGLAFVPAPSRANTANAVHAAPDSERCAN